MVRKTPFLAPFLCDFISITDLSAAYLGSAVEQFIVGQLCWRWQSVQALDGPVIPAATLSYLSTRSSLGHLSVQPTPSQSDLALLEAQSQPNT